MGTDLRTLFVPPGETILRHTTRILFVGRLVRNKGLEYLLNAIAILKRTEPSIGLIVAGDGPMRKELASKVKKLELTDCVTFLGSVRNSKLPAQYQSAAVAVFPFTGQQGFGLVITEAMGCGCPVIASDLPAMRQTIKHGVTGFLSPPGDAKALAETIQTCLADDELRRKVASTALDSVRKQFDWPIIADKYFKIIEESVYS